jgi:hypothetical protein
VCRRWHDAVTFGDRHALFSRIAGIACGLGGVAVLVGGPQRDNAPPVWSIVEVLIVVVCATAPFWADRRLADVPSSGVTAALSASSHDYASIAATKLPTRAQHQRDPGGVGFGADLHGARAHRVLPTVAEAARRRRG